MRGSDDSPNQEDRDRKHQRFSHSPGETEAFATKARIDLTNQQGANHPPLDQNASPQHDPYPVAERRRAARPPHARVRSPRAARRHRKRPGSSRGPW